MYEPHLHVGLFASVRSRLLLPRTREVGVLPWRSAKQSVSYTSDSVVSTGRCDLWHDAEHDHSPFIICFSGQLVRPKNHPVSKQAMRVDFLQWFTINPAVHLVVGVHTAPSCTVETGTEIAKTQYRTAMNNRLNRKLNDGSLLHSNTKKLQHGKKKPTTIINKNL